MFMLAAHAAVSIIMNCHYIWAGPNVEEDDNATTVTTIHPPREHPSGKSEPGSSFA